jgi:hypothetical protein
VGAGVEAIEETLEVDGAAGAGGGEDQFHWGKAKC